MKHVGRILGLMAFLLSTSLAFGGTFDCRQHIKKAGTDSEKKCNKPATGWPAPDANAACAAAKAKCCKLPKSYGTLTKVTCRPAGATTPVTTCSC